MVGQSSPYVRMKHKIRYDKIPKFESVENTCIQAQELLRKIRKLTTNPAEVAHFDEEFKDLVRLIERLKK